MHSFQMAVGVAAAAKLFAVRIRDCWAKNIFHKVNVSIECAKNRTVFSLNLYVMFGMC